MEAGHWPLFYLFLCATQPTRNTTKIAKGWVQSVIMPRTTMKALTTLKMIGFPIHVLYVEQGSLVVLSRYRMRKRPIVQSKKKKYSDIPVILLALRISESTRHGSARWIAFCEIICTNKRYETIECTNDDIWRGNTSIEDHGISVILLDTPLR